MIAGLVGFIKKKNADKRDATKATGAVSGLYIFKNNKWMEK